VIDPVSNLDTAQEFCHLAAELPFDVHTQRRAIRKGKRHMNVDRFWSFSNFPPRRLPSFRPSVPVKAMRQLAGAV
jgi:hypothetical protein